MTRNTLYNGALVLLALIVLAGTGGPAAAQHLGDAASSGTAGDAPEMEVTDLDPTDVVVRQGDTITVSANVTNVGNATGTAGVSLLFDEAEIATTGETVEENETRSVQLTVTVDLEPGEYNLTIATAGDSKTGTLTVEAEPECNRYVDEDGVATLDGALNAIDDYENGDLSLDRVLLVIDSYELQVPLQELIEDQDGGSALTWCY